MGNLGIKHIYQQIETVLQIGKGLSRVLYFCIFLATNSSAQNYLTKISTFSIEDGLSSRFVNNFMEDSRGFVWITTSHGLNRFDGKSFKIFFREKTGIYSGRCGNTVEDIHGNIWVTFVDKDQKNNTWHGLIDSTYQTHTIADWFAGKMPFDPSEIVHIHQTSERVLLILTSSGQLYQYDGQFRKLAENPKLNIAKFLGINTKDEIILSDSSTIFTITRQGKISKQRFEPIQQVKPFKAILLGDKVLFHPVFMSNDKLNPYKIKTDKELIPKFKDASFIDSLLEKGPPLVHLALLPEDTLCYIAHIDYLVSFNLQGELIHDYSANLTGASGYQSIRGGFFFRQGQIWYANNDGFSIMSIKKNDFKPLLNFERRISTRQISKRSNGNLLVASYHGVKEFNYEKDLIHEYPFGMLTPICGLSELRKDYWVSGLYSDAILFYNPETSEEHLAFIKDKKQTPSQFLRPNFLNPFQDKARNLWLGTTSGLFTYNPRLDLLEMFTCYNNFPELQSKTINYFKETDQGIWLATSDGLYLLDPEEGITSYLNPVPDSNIQHFYKEGPIFWLASYGNGLIYHNEETGATAQFSRGERLEEDQMTAVYPDKKGFLWLSSTHGLVRFDTLTKQFYSFLQSDGISHDEFNRFSHFQDEKGRIYFGGLNGITAFQPEEVLNRPEKTFPLNITAYYEMDGTTGNIDEKTSRLIQQRAITLAPSIKSFQIHFALLNYENTDQTLYKYKIEGLDQKWNYQEENSLRINQLPYGKYKLNIMAQDYTGQWNPENLLIPITVQAPWYAKSKWRMTGFLLSVLGIFLFYKQRTHVLKKEQEKLRKLVKRRTATIESQKEELAILNDTKDQIFAILAHDLRNPVIAFEEFSQSINYLLRSKNPERVLNLGNYIEKEAKQLHHLLDNLLNWALAQRDKLPITPLRLPLHEIANAVAESNKNLSEMTNISILVDIPETLIVLADPRVLETVFRNLVSNAFRYTKDGGWIKISAQAEGEKIKILLADNGMGMNQKELAKLFKINTSEKSGRNSGSISFGLYLCRELIELLNGNIIVSSQEMKGTMFTIRLPSGG